MDEFDLSWLDDIYNSTPSDISGGMSNADIESLISGADYFDPELLGILPEGTFDYQPAQVPDSLQPPAGALSQAEQMGPNTPEGWKAPAPKGEISTIDKLMRGLGLQDKNGAFDISNPKTLDAVMKMILGGGSAINALLGGTKAKGYTSAADLRASVAGPYDKFNPQQQAWASNYFNNPSTPRRTVNSANLPSSVVRGYAEGGPVGALSLIEGNGGGQDDIVDAALAPGEFVFDADTVAAVGDGSNEHGARLLDEWRRNLRQHKRSASPDDIPPQTGDLNRFMPGGANGIA